jgi:uncharacterized protein
VQQQQIILKLAERCNINCTYCYYFNGNEHSYASRPATITSEAVDGLQYYISKTLAARHVDRIQVIFHGGEPLMVGRRRFGAICSALRDTASEDQLDLCLQTNATLIDDRWIDLLSKFDVKVCTSLDGTQEIHDRNRVDRKGNGTYWQTVRGIQLLLRAFEQGRLSSVACLSVIQPEFSGRDAYRHIAGLGFSQMDFLLPDLTHADFVGCAKDYGRFLIEVFDAWIEDDDPHIHIRLLKSIMSVLLGGRSYLAGFGTDLPNALTVRSDGAVELDDFLRMCGMDAVHTGVKISQLDSAQLFASEKMVSLRNVFNTRPQFCKNCLFVASCRGGQITHRFSQANGFRNQSVFCDGLFDLFQHVSKFLIRSGIPISRIPGIQCDQPQV